LLSVVTLRAILLYLTDGLFALHHLEEILWIIGQITCPSSFKLFESLCYKIELALSGQWLFRLWMWTHLQAVLLIV
jgi:hypothetical protein